MINGAAKLLRNASRCAARGLLYSTMSQDMGPLTLETVEKRLNAWLKPKLLAEPWDNVGILIGSTKEKHEKMIKKILLCNDLTPAVIDEAVAAQVDMIITYHPLLFKAIKTVAYGSWNERVVAKCIANDIVVYSPHTALDVIPGGVNDQLVEFVAFSIRAANGIDFLRPITSRYAHPFSKSKALLTSEELASKLFLSTLDDTNSFHFCMRVTGYNDFSSVITGIAVDESSMTNTEKYPPEIDEYFQGPSYEGYAYSFEAERFWPGAAYNFESGRFWPGAGRYFTVKLPISLYEVLRRLNVKVGSNVQLAGNTDGTKLLTRFGVCAGSGGSLAKECPDDVECFITGEMAHHEILDFIHSGKKGSRTLILLGHSESERHFLPILKKQLKIVLFSEHNAPEISVSASDHSPLSVPSDMPGASEQS